MTNPFGSMFAEEIVKGSGRRRLSKNSQNEDQSLSGSRLFFLSFFFVFGLGLLLVKLFSLTIIEGEKYRQLSLNNRIKETKIPSPRGIIYDREGEPLVRNIPAFVTSEGVIYYENLPTAFSSDIKEITSRDYIYKEDTAHVLGYVGQADPEEIKNLGLDLGDNVGKMGIEKTYDKILRGRDGRELVEVDALGNQVRVLGSVSGVAGTSLTLTIDEKLQNIARVELGSKKGAVIAENPINGEILALYSSPSFDPNRLIRKEEVESLLADRDLPFFNRVISGLYPPGSTFKIVMALAALETGAIDKSTQFEDTGVLTIGQFSFGNWYFSQYGRKEGMLDIVGAIRRSNDIFFYKTGEATGITNLASFAKRLGVGNTLGIDIDGEAAGLMPDPLWRKKAFGAEWYLGDTYHVAIGQGELQTTPIQINAWANLIANGGKLCKPHLVKGKDEPCKDLGIKKENIALVAEGMKAACSPASPAGGPGGTGWPLFNFAVPESSVSGGLNSRVKIDGIDFKESPVSTISAKRMIGISTACKTGTAEFGDPKNRTHAVFTVFAPVEKPQISVTVLVEGGGEGSSVAAPIAKKILEKWFSS